MALALALALLAVANQRALAHSDSNKSSHSTLTTLDAPDYGGVFASGNYNTPAADGRPGMMMFAYGVAAYRKGDYRHAIHMYKVAASWAYKPAEYNLGLMYFNGVGVPADHALGAAWMVLAAERGDSYYTKVRDMMVTLLSKSEFAQTDKYWNQLKPIYGDKAALTRAELQWRWVMKHPKGSRVGGLAGAGQTCDGIAAVGSGVGSQQPGIGASGSCASLAGSYAQSGQSDNPYSPIYLKNRKGNVTVESLQRVKAPPPHAQPDTSSRQ